MNPAPPVIRSVPKFQILDRRALGILQRESQLLRQRLDGRAGALPLPLGFEAEVADAATPRRNDPTDRTEITAIGVLLVQTPDHVGRDADERPERRRTPDAVLAPVPCGAEDQCDLLEIVHEELLRFFVNVGRAPSAEYAVLGEQLFQFLRQRCLRDAAAADTEQLDL